MEETIEDLMSPEEKVLWKGRRNNATLNTYLLGGLIITIILAIFFFSQGHIEHDLSSERITSGRSIAALTIFIGFVISFAIYSSKQASIYIITDKKVIVQHGLITKRLGYAYHSNIKHIDISHGFIGNFFNVGTVYIDSGKKLTSQMRRKEIRGLNMNPMKPQILYDIIKDVENPQKVYNLIERLVEKNKTKSSPFDINTRIPKDQLPNQEEENKDDEKTQINKTPKTIEEDLKSIKEEDLLKEERKEISPRTKKLIIGFSGLLLILLFLSFIYLQYPLINIIEGQIESRSVNNNILQLKDFRIIFTDEAMNFVKTSYENNKDVETSLCLEGVKNGNDYFINSAYTPKIYEQSYRHVTSEPCSNNTRIIFHTHPYKSCLASGTDINTLKSTQNNRPDTIMVIMCEPNKFSTYK